MEQLQCDYILKFLTLGAAGSGKSCIVHRLLSGAFKSDSQHTVGVELASKMLELSGRTVKLQVWDTAGQERFRAVTRSYYRGAAGAILVYDITSRESFRALDSWLSDARNLSSPQLTVMMVGNKKDLESTREVSFMEASQYAQDNGCLYLETSAKTGDNVQEAFLKCAQSVMTKVETGDINPTQDLSGVSRGSIIRATTRTLPREGPSCCQR